MNLLTGETAAVEQTFLDKLNANSGVILFAIAILVGVVVIAWIGRKFLKRRR